MQEIERWCLPVGNTQITTSISHTTVALEMATELSKPYNKSWPYQSEAISPLLARLVQWAADAIDELMEDEEMWQKFITSGAFHKQVIARLQRPATRKRKRESTVEWDKEGICLSD